MAISLDLNKYLSEAGYHVKVFLTWPYIKIELFQVLLFQVQLFQEMPEGLYFK